MSLKSLLIYKYWLFKQFNLHPDLNNDFYRLLYEILKPKQLTTPTKEHFIDNIYDENEYISYYSIEQIKFTVKRAFIENLFRFDLNQIEYFDKDFNLRVSFGIIKNYVTFELDFANSLINKSNITLKSGLTYFNPYQYKNAVFDIL
jgi:hypothetical protein